MQKTYKRETAWALLTFTALMSVAAIYYDPSLTIELVKLWLIPSFTYAAAAFGFDAFSKQTSHPYAKSIEMGVSKPEPKPENQIG